MSEEKKQEGKEQETQKDQKKQDEKRQDEKDAQNLAVTENKPLANAADIPVVDSDIDPNDIDIPRIKLLQALSKEVQDEIAKDGRYFNTTTNQQMEFLEFIPITYSKSRVRFDQDNRTGAPLCRSFDGKVGTDGMACDSCEHSKWTKDNKPTCDLSYNFLIILPSQIGRERLPCVISFLRSQIKDVAKKIIAYRASTNRNHWSVVWKLTPVKGDFQKGKAWVSTPQQTRPATDKEQLWAYEIYKMFGKRRVDSVEDMDSVVDVEI